MPLLVSSSHNRHQKQNFKKQSQHFNFRNAFDIFNEMFMFMNIVDTTFQMLNEFDGFAIHVIDIGNNDIDIDINGIKFSQPKIIQPISNVFRRAVV